VDACVKVRALSVFRCVLQTSRQDFAYGHRLKYVKWNISIDAVILVVMDTL